MDPEVLYTSLRTVLQQVRVGLFIPLSFLSSSHSLPLSLRLSCFLICLFIFRIGLETFLLSGTGCVPMLECSEMVTGRGGWVGAIERPSLSLKV